VNSGSTDTTTPVLGMVMVVQTLIDNHGRSVKITERVSMMGNAGDIDQVLADMNIGAALDLPNLDVLTNTFGTMRLRALSDADADRDTDGDVGGDSYFEDHFLQGAVAPWHLAVASNVAALRIPNVYDPGVSYRADIEDLRSHSNVRAFRDMLTQKEPDVLEAADAAREITEMAGQFARRQVAKNFTRKPWYRSLGRLAIGPAGNAIHPGLGSAAAGSIKVMEYLRRGEERSVGSWAAFVSSLEDSA
jgi:hypothetical protein